MKKSRKTIETFEQYKHKLFLNKTITIFIRLFLVIGFISIWEIGARYQWFDTFLVSQPSAIYNLFLTYCKSGELTHHVLISVYETLLGLLIGTSAGLLIAIMLYMLPKVYRVLDPILVVLNALPKTALAPILIIWIGTGVKGIVAVSVSLSLIVTIIQAYTYFKSVDDEKIRMLKSYGANHFKILTKLVIPCNLANIIALIKINIGLAWVGVIVGEFLVSRNGIGYLVVYGGQVFKMDLVMMGVVILAIIAYAMYEILVLIEKLFNYHREKRRKR